MLLLCIHIPAAAQDVESGVEQGKIAFDQERYAEAVEAFEAVLAYAPDDAEAHYWLARIYLETPLLNVSKASDHYGAALKQEPENEQYLQLRLYRWMKHPPWRPPPVLLEMQNLYARRLLDLHPANALAHQHLGKAHFDQFEQRYHRVGFSLQDAERAPFTYEPELVETDSGAAIEFVTRQGDTVPFVSKRAAALEEYEKAVAHLRQAIASDPEDTEAYRTLMHGFVLRKNYDEALAMLNAVPPPFRDTATYGLYLGLTQWQKNQPAAAQQSFTQALTQLPESDRAAFENIASFLNNVQKAEYESDSSAYKAGFWEARDPWFLSTINERRLEHYARLVLADLRYGNDDISGWEVAPGQVIMRYGEPLAEIAPNRTQWDVQYGDLKFRFMRMVPTSAPIFYSPSASAFAGASPRNEVWDNDYELKSREIFRELPERSAYKVPGTQIAVPYLVSSFKRDDGLADVYVPFGVRVPARRVPVDLPLGIETGVFLVDPAAGLVDEERARLSLLSAKRIREVGDESYWLGLAHLAATPGTKQVAIEFQTGTAGIIGRERAGVEVPDFSGAELALSDLMLAYGAEEVADAREVPGRVLRRGVLVEPAPTNRFDVGQPLYFYFELYHLTQAASGATQYEIEAALVEKKSEGRRLDQVISRALRGKQRGSVSVRFDGRGTAADEGRYLILDTSDQAAGAYILVLRIRDVIAGKEAEVRRDVRLGG